MNDDFQRFSNELSRIPCPLCRSNMRLKLSLRLLMAQYKHLCEHCKDKVSFIDKKCICKEKTRLPVDKDENDLFRRIKNFYRSIVPSPRFIHKTKILPLLDEYNPFQSVSVHYFSEYDTMGRQMKLAESEPNLSLGRPSAEPFRKYDRTEDFKKTNFKYQSDDGQEDDRRKSDRDYGRGRDRDGRDHEYGAARDRYYGVGRERDGTGRNRDYGVGSDREYSVEKELDVTGTDLQYSASVAGKDFTSSEARKSIARSANRRDDSTIGRSTRNIVKDSDESREKKRKSGDDVQVTTKKYGVKDTNEKLKNSDKEKDVVEGKVKNTKKAFKKKPSDRDKKGTEGKEKKGKEGDKKKATNKEQGVTEGKVKKGKGGDKGKAKNDLIDDIESKEKDGGEKVKHGKDKEDDERYGKKLKDTTKEPIRSNKDKDQIELDILSFSERRELLKKKGEVHRKKARGKKHGDSKEEEPKKKPKSERSEDEQGPDKSKVKKKDTEVDNDLATPLTYTEDTDRTPGNPFLKQGLGGKKSKKKHKKSIGKISAGSIEQIITPKVKPKILELINKLMKTPRTRDKYYERISSRTSRYLQFDDVDYSPPEMSFLDLLNVPSPRKFHSCIVGNRIIKYKPPMPKFSEVEEYSVSVKPRVYVKYEEKPPQIGKDRTKTRDDTNLNDMGVLCYSLSDRSFISKGYTILPTEKIMRKLNVYRMRPSNPHNNWFARNRRKKRINYESGQKLAVFENDERCRIYYKNGNVALDYYQAEDNQAKERIVLYSDGENELKQPVPATVLATFDHMGTGVIFDKKGNVRAKYNQNDGVVLDKTLGPYTKWKWHKLNDPPVLEEVMMDTMLPNKDPRILRMYSKEQLPRVVDEKILEIEFQNSLKEKGKKIFKSFKPFPIKMKAFKINDQFSLHIMDQTKIYLSFRDGPTSFRIDVGMILDCNEIIDMETSELGEVDVPIERKPARTSSMHNLQRSVEHARLLERKRHSRSQRQRPTVEPCHLAAAAHTPAWDSPKRLPLLLYQEYYLKKIL